MSEDYENGNHIPWDAIGGIFILAAVFFFAFSWDRFWMDRQADVVVRKIEERKR